MKIEKLRKQVALLRKLGMFCPADETFEVRRALTSEDLEAAYRLVHDMFVEKGYIDEKPDGMRMRTYEAVPQTATFVCKHKGIGEIVAVMSVVIDSPDMGLPSDQVFKNDIDALRGKGRLVCEFTNLAVSGKYWRSNAFTALTQACLAHTRHMSCDDIFIAVSPGHTNFFESILGFQKCNTPRIYSSEKADIVQAEILDVRTMKDVYRKLDAQLEEQAFLSDYYFAQNPFTHIVGIWAMAARPTYKNAFALRELLLNGSRIEQRFDPGQLRIIQNRWGGMLLKRDRRQRPLRTVKWPTTAKKQTHLEFSVQYEQRLQATV